MKPQDNQPDLARALARWQVSPSVPPNAKAELWRRIARAEAQPRVGWWRLFRSFSEWLPTPAASVGVATVMLLFGVLFGFGLAERQTGRASAALSERYLKSVDPYQKVHAAAFSHE